MGIILGFVFSFLISAAIVFPVFYVFNLPINRDGIRFRDWLRHWPTPTDPDRWERYRAEFERRQ